jgi:deazaflavin-dependent oxidoreductase (nitroreductase family)
LKKTNPNSSSKDSNFDREQYLYLTTRGRKTGLPREIEIWFTCRDGRFYLIAEYPTSNWLQNLRAGPQAQVRVAGQSFAAHARFIAPEAEPELHRAIASLSTQKYGWGEGTVVELQPVTDGDGNSRRLS